MTAAKRDFSSILLYDSKTQTKANTMGVCTAYQTPKLHVVP